MRTERTVQVCAPDESYEMAISRRATQLGGDSTQPALGRSPRARGRSELSGHSGSTGPVVRRMISLPLVMVVIEGERYLVSMPGAEADWVQNVKSADGNVTLRHGRREEVHLEEVAADRRAPVLKAYLKRAPGARPHLPVDKDAPLSEFERVSAQFPVFRVVSGSAGLQPIKVLIARARVRRAVSILAGLLVVGLSGLAYISYRRDIHQRASASRLAARSSRRPAARLSMRSPAMVRRYWSCMALAAAMTRGWRLASHWSTAASASSPCHVSATFVHRCQATLRRLRKPTRMPVCSTRSKSVARRPSAPPPARHRPCSSR